MPRLGTKKVKRNGKDVFVPAEEARIEHLVGEATGVIETIATQQERLDKIKAELVAIAGRHRGAKSTVHMDATAGRATVIWPSKKEVDSDIAEELRSQLGIDWDKVFTAKVEHRLARGYRGWMKSAPAAARAIKARIAEAIRVIPLRAQVRFEAAAGEEDDG